MWDGRTHRHPGLVAGHPPIAVATDPVEVTTELATCSTCRGRWLRQV